MFMLIYFRLRKRRKFDKQTNQKCSVNQSKSQFKDFISSILTIGGNIDRNTQRLKLYSTKGVNWDLSIGDGVAGSESE